MARSRQFVTVVAVGLSSILGVMGAANADSVPTSQNSKPTPPVIAVTGVTTIDSAKWAAYDKLRTAVEASPDIYAGLSDHGDGTNPSTELVHIATGHQLDSSVQVAIKQARNARISVTTDTQPKSLTQLQGLQETVRKDTLLKNVRYFEIGIQASTNQIWVGLPTNPVSGNQALTVTSIGDSLLTKYGKAVTVKQVEVPANASTRLTDTRQFYGADRITSSTGVGCSAAFALTNASGWQYEVTAGHCGGGPAKTGSTWFSNGIDFGRMDFNRWTDNGFDAALIKRVGDNSNFAGRVWVGAVSSTTSLSVHGSYLACDGCGVYLDGSVSGERYGTTSGNGYCSQGTYYQCDQQKVLGNLITGGDSGGPSYVYGPGATYTEAVGVIQGGGSGYAIIVQMYAILRYWTCTLTQG